MTDPYSRDLRERIIAAMKRPDTTYESVAAQFSVGRATVNRIWRLYRCTCEEFPPVLRGKPARALEPADLEVLRQLVAEQPDATLEAVRDDMVNILGRKISRATVGRELRRMGITRKKRASSRASGTSSASRRSASATSSG
jgi:transposase